MGAGFMPIPWSNEPTVSTRHLQVTTQTPPRLSGCPTRELLDRVGDKWSVLLLMVLAAGEARRTSELRRAVPELSAKVLTQTLRALEQDGFVVRTVRSASPPHVEYSLSPLGRSLVAALGALTTWAEANIDAVHAARAAPAPAYVPWLAPRAFDAAASDPSAAAP